MADIKKIAIKGTTQQHLPIEDITENIVVLKDGSCCVILETPSVNFDLLSDKEQDAMIYAYGALLNSLNFPIQIYIRSSMKDVSSYLVLLKEWENKQDSDLFKKMVSSYRKFIDELVQKNEVLTKSFYIVIPFSVYEMGLQSAKVGMASIFPFLPSSKKVSESLPLPKNQILKRAKANLEPKKDHIVRAFGRLGLKIRQMETKELINLFYSIYNEESVSIKNTTVENMNSPVTLKK
jgi:type IV secretory pathway VirB4 component